MPESADAADIRARIRQHRRRDAVTTLVGAWLTGGLFLDGWAHNNLPSLETFFTPWHALFYSGFAACAAWILYVALRDRIAGRSWRETVPPGYGLSLVGIVVFGVSGAGDLTWHTIFGIERGIAALLSPTHLGLIIGAFLVVTTPFRATVADGLIPRSGGWRQLGPAVASVTLAGLLLAFIFQNVAQFSQNQFVSLGVGQYIGGVVDVPDLANWHTDALVFAFLIDSLFLFGPWLMLARSYRPPRFSLLLMITAQVILLQAIRGFADPGLIIGAVASGLVAELLVVLVVPGPDDYRRLRVAAFLLPLVFWGVYLGLMAAHDHGLGVKPEIWGGAVLWSGLMLLALTTLATVTTQTPAGATLREV
jgi:hypothetical protein